MRCTMVVAATTYKEKLNDAIVLCTQKIDSLNQFLEKIELCKKQWQKDTEAFWNSYQIFKTPKAFAVFEKKLQTYAQQVLITFEQLQKQHQSVVDIFKCINDVRETCALPVFPNEIYIGLAGLGYDIEDIKQKAFEIEELRSTLFYNYVVPIEKIFKQACERLPKAAQELDAFFQFKVTKKLPWRAAGWISSHILPYAPIADPTPYLTEALIKYCEETLSVEDEKQIIETNTSSAMETNVSKEIAVATGAALQPLEATPPPTEETTPETAPVVQNPITAEQPNPTTQPQSSS